MAAVEMLINDETCKRVQEENAVLVSQPGRSDMFLVSEAYFKELQRAKNNMDFLDKLERGRKQIESGNLQYHALVEA